MVIFISSISQGSVVKYLRRDVGFFNEHFIVANLLLRVSIKGFRKSVNIWLSLKL